MDSRHDYATPELRDLLRKRLRIVEGKEGSAARGPTSPSGQPPRSLQGTTSAPVRIPEQRRLAANGTGQRGASYARSAGNRFQPTVPTLIRNGAGVHQPTDDRSGDLQISQEKIAAMSQRNSLLCAEVEKLKTRLSAEESGNLAQDDRTRLINQADELLAQTVASSQQNHLVQPQLRDRSTNPSQNGPTPFWTPEEPAGGSAGSDRLTDAALRAELQALRSQNEKLRDDNAGQQKESLVLKAEVAALQKAATEKDEEIQRLRSDLAAARSSQGSESRLRAVMTSQNATVEELRQAIGSVDAMLNEARRELERNMLRDRRAAYEQLHTAIDKADEQMLEAAIEAARRAEVDDEDILKGQVKLLELQEITPEEKAARARQQAETQRKKDAFQFIKKDDVNSLTELLDSLDEDVRWQDWRDAQGRTLLSVANALRSAGTKAKLDERIKALQAPISSLANLSKRFGRQRSTSSEDVSAEPLSRSADGPAPVEQEEEASAAQVLQAVPDLGPSRVTARGAGVKVLDLEAIRAPSPPPQEEAPEPAILPDDEAEESKPELSTEEVMTLKAKAFRAVVQDDCEIIESVLAQVRRSVWSRWENNSGTNMLVLSQERHKGGSRVYSVLAKSLGLVKEVKRESFEEKQTVWVFLKDDVQPRRATVLEDTPEESEDVLLEFWDGDDPPERIERCKVHSMET